MRLIVIGASYGGLHVLMDLLGALTTGFPVPIAVAQHRSADSGDSERLGEVLSRYSSLPVRDAEHGERIGPPGVYLAPSDYHLIVEDECFELTVDDVEQYSRPSIDVLFDSAARTYGAQLTAVLLTGFGHDGTAGMRAVHEAGGCTVAQDPRTAAEAAMPRSAIEAGVVDEVLSVDEIALGLLRAGQVRSG